MKSTKHPSQINKTQTPKDTSSQILTNKLKLSKYTPPIYKNKPHKKHNFAKNLKKQLALNKYSQINRKPSQFQILNQTTYAQILYPKKQCIHFPQTIPIFSHELLKHAIGPGTEKFSTHPLLPKNPTTKKTHQPDDSNFSTMSSNSL